MVEFKTHPTVELLDANASDQSVARAARVSTGTESSESFAGGLINSLMRNRHGSPFEHNYFTFRVHAPIFVAREFVRHRVGWSYNEESARYKELEPVFWVPDVRRRLVQVGKPMDYKVVYGNDQQHLETVGALRLAATEAYGKYKQLLEAGIAREVARAVLPVSVYTSFYATCNARSLMHLLSLRIDSLKNKYDTHPLAEIQEVAELMEEIFKDFMPITWGAWDRNGRVAP